MALNNVRLGRHVEHLLAAAPWCVHACHLIVHCDRFYYPPKDKSIVAPIRKHSVHDALISASVLCCFFVKLLDLVRGGLFPEVTTGVATDPSEMGTENARLLCERKKNQIRYRGWFYVELDTR